MDLQITDKALKEVACDALVVGAIRSKAEQNTNGVVLSKAAKEVDAVLGGLLSEICSGGEFRGSLGDMTTIYTMGKLTAKRVIVVGLGPQDTLNVQSLRRASAIATRNLQQTGAQQVALALFLDDVPVEEELAAQAQVEGALLGTYAFKKYLHSDDNGRGITQVWLVAAKASTASLEQAMHKGSVLAEATNFARDLVNEPPNVLTPTERRTVPAQWPNNSDWLARYWSALRCKSWVWEGYLVYHRAVLSHLNSSYCVTRVRRRAQTKEWLLLGRVSRLIQ